MSAQSGDLFCCIPNPRTLLKRFIALVAACVIGFASGVLTVANAAAPSDAELFRQIVEKAHSGGLRSNNLQNGVADLLVEETLAYVDELARARDYPDWFSRENPLIAHEVSKLVRTAVERTEGKPSELYNLGAEVFSGQHAEVAMARAAGLPVPRLPGSRGTRWLGEGARVTNPKGPLQLQTTRSTISEDRGTTGHGNGRLDPGETALLTMIFENTGSSRLFSTSLYIDSMSDCLYVGNVVDKERQLKELEPGESDEFAVRIFASRHCAGQTARLKVRGHDTQRFPGGVSYTIDLKLSALGSSKLYGVMIDGDDFGHSEPGYVSRLQPKHRVELSAGLLVSGSGVAGMSQSFSVPEPLEATHDSGQSSFVYSGGVSRAGPADDVDISVPGPGALDAGLKSHAARMGWEEPEDAILFIAVDTEIRTGKPGGSANAGGKKPAAVGPTVDRREVEKVLAEHVTVTPVTSRGGSTRGEEIPLVSVDGFRVSVDDPNALMSALESSISYTSTTSSSGPSVGSALANSNGSSQYRVRHYVALPIGWSGAPAPVECSINVSRGRITEGGSVTVYGQIENLPPTARVLVEDSVAGRLFASVDDDGHYKATVTPQSAGARRVGIVVKQGAEQLCREVAPYTVLAAAPVVADIPDDLDSEDENWPRRMSLEPGYLRHAGSNASQAAFSIGGDWRFATRVASGQGDFGFGLGPRFTKAWDGEFTVEASVQALLGVDTYTGGFIEGGVVLAAHGTVGPFVHLGAGAGDLVGGYGYGGLGLGLYFPAR